MPELLDLSSRESAERKERLKKLFLLLQKTRHNLVKMTTEVSDLFVK
jgi:hypothetical protein